VTPGVLNAGVEFDPETLEPRYRLSYGTSAPSHAFLVAEKMGLSRDILNRAREYQGKTEGETAAMIQRLEELRAEVDRERDRFQSLQEELTQRRDRLDGLLRKVREKRDHILSRIEDRAKGLFKETEKELDRLVHAPGPVEPGQKKPQTELREIENRFRSRLKRARRKRSKVENLRPGEWVRVLDLNREGTVSQVEETIDTVEVLVGQFKIKTSLRNVERIGTRREASRKTSAPLSVVSPASEPTREINVIGMRVDEALPLVDKFIDRALVQNYDSVTVVHGIGSDRA